MSESKTTVNVGGGIGTILATALSWATNHSVWYAFLHFWCGWIYVIYNIFTYGLPHLPVR